YRVRNALSLRDHGRIVGEPGKTILVACESVEARLAADGDCNERQITVADDTAFRIGDGVAIRDDRNASGFEVTTATLSARVRPGVFRISMPLYLDYLVSRQATARLAFPVVG